ncbi:MAG TPA: MerR family transcriptional regulator [Polyangiaceae bacterium]|nr:MerR family transcriptional regulator [Polyangiaceae bacterium]
MMLPAAALEAPWPATSTDAGHAPPASRDPMTTPADPESFEFTIDELAAAARLPSRTIRFYQSRGALMPPEIRGRVAYYGKPHLERLKLIAQLQDRGLRIDAIRDLLASIDRGELDLAEWLGVEQQVQAPWANDQPRTLTEHEVYEMAGTDRPGLLSELVRVGMIERHGEVYLVRSPALLTIAMKLEGAGVDLRTAARAEEIVVKHLRRAASELVELFVQRATDGALGPKELGKFLESLRPLGTEAVRLIFGRAMEAQLRKLYESGLIAKIPVRVQRARKGS